MKKVNPKSNQFFFEIDKFCNQTSWVSESRQIDKNNMKKSINFQTLAHPIFGLRVIIKLIISIIFCI